ncbi:MAG: helix-turn-helix transcriptional regulator [Bacteroidia bacterium]|nr:helix-turn-helix transcriptional regulator [Bacteroidia bacterium]
MIDTTERTPVIKEFSKCTRHLLPVMDTMELLSGRWKLVIIMALWFGGKMRFNAIRSHIPKITGKVLSKELKYLETHKILTRTVHDTAPITVEYALTTYGKTLKPVIFALKDWGTQHRSNMMG